MIKWNRLVGEGPGWEPSPEVTANLLGIVNEALSNVARHAMASRVTVEASGDPDRNLYLSVRDNGRGFDRARCDARCRKRTRIRDRDLHHATDQPSMRKDGR